MRRITVETTITRQTVDGEEVEIEITGTYLPAVRAQYPSRGNDTGSPPEDEEVEILSSTVDGQDIELDAEEESKAIEALLEKGREEDY